MTPTSPRRAALRAVVLRCRGSVVGVLEMGLLDKHRARVAEEAARREATQRSAAYSTWYSERQQLAGMIEDAQNFRGVTRADAPDLSLQLKKGETVLGVLRGCSLIEPRRGPGHYQGGYQ